MTSRLSHARWYASITALLVLALAIVACGDDDDDSSVTPPPGDATATATDEGGGSGELRDVTVMLDWTPNTNHAGIMIAKESGYYEDAGLNVSIIEPGASGVAQVVAAGQADFGISVQESVVPARAQGVPIVSIAAILQHNDSSLVSLASEGIEDTQDLAGKTYGGFGGPLEEALISQLVTCGGGDPDSVTYANVGNVDYLVGMEQGRYDFAWIFNGWDGIRLENLGEPDVNTLNFSDHYDCIPDWYTPVIITSESLIADNPGLVQAFMSATTKGYNEAISNAEASADALLAFAPELDETLVRDSAAYLTSRYVDEGRQWGLQDEAIWNNFVSFLVEQGIIDSPIDVTQAYTNAFLPE